MEIGPLIQITGLIAGWIIVHRQSSKRDIDKARREMIAKTADSLNDDTTKIFGVAKDYHIKVRDPSVEDSIKMSLQDLSIRTSLLNKVCKDEGELKICRNAVLELKKSITGEHFEDEHTIPLGLSSDQIKGIAESILRTKRAFLELKQKQFPMS